MATHHGKNGVVKVGTYSVAEVRGWNVTEQVDTVDTSVQGSTAKTHMTGIPEWSGDMECFWDETDTNGQQALTIGTSVTLNLYPEGAGAGATYKTGTASITQVGMAVPHDGGVMRSFNFQGNGALSEAIVGA